MCSLHKIKENTKCPALTKWKMALKWYKKFFKNPHYIIFVNNSQSPLFRIDTYGTLINDTLLLHWRFSLSKGPFLKIIPWIQRITLGTNKCWFPTQIKLAFIFINLVFILKYQISNLKCTEEAYFCCSK